MFATLSAVLVLLISFYYYKCLKKFEYWKKRGVKGPTPIPIVGNLLDIMLKKRSFGIVLQDFCQYFPDEEVIGIYKASKPALIVRSPEIIKQIMIKDFVKFADRGMGDKKNSSFNDNLFTSDGNSWRVLRQRLSPAFSSGKIKSMFPLLLKSTKALEENLNKLIENGCEPEVRELFAKFTLDAIGSCAFGIDVDGFCEGENKYRIIGDKIFNTGLKVVTKRMINFLFPFLYPILKWLLADNEAKDFFFNLVQAITEQRKANPSARNDFMHLLIEMKEEGEISDRKNSTNGQETLKVTDKLIASQVAVFYAAGFETSSRTMAFVLYELALNNDIQAKLRDEVDKVYEKYEGITYEGVVDMSYMDMVISETLRKYPVGDTLFRTCTQECKLEANGLTIEEGISIFLPVYTVHHDPNIFKNPEQFNPERFSAENKVNIPSCAYFPFGEGPRNCIGMRFAKVLSTVGIATVLRNFVVSRSDKTEEPLQFSPKTVTLSSLNGIWIQFKKRK